MMKFASIIILGAFAVLLEACAGYESAEHYYASKIGVSVEEMKAFRAAAKLEMKTADEPSLLQASGLIETLASACAS